MKPGLGLQCSQLDLDHYRFARQCGCTHLMLHLTGEIRLPRARLREEAPAIGYAVVPGQEPLWTYEELALLTEAANAAGLQVEAIDNLNPAHSLDDLLVSPDRVRRMQQLKTIIRNVGHAGVPVLTYHFSLRQTAGRGRGRFARGDAETLVFDSWPGEIPGYRPASLINLDPIASFWDGLSECLEELLPVAEEAGVTLAAQVGQLPAPEGQMRALHWLGAYEKLIGLHPSTRHGIVFDVAETAAAGNDVYAALEACSRQRRIACVRFGNVGGAGPPHEAFIDEGDVEMLRIVRILRRNHFGGLIVPGGAPQVGGTAPWHTGMAHTLGYLLAAIQSPAAADV